MAYRLGIDIGGTFTDFALVDDETGALTVYKQLTTPHDPSEAVLSGLAAMLAPVDKGFFDLPATERVRLLLLRWFDSLAPRRQTTAAMLAGKLYPAHPHHWVPMVFDLSRLIHWLRDAAGLDAGGRQRQAEEIALSALFVATLAVWCRDDSEDQARTRAFLDRRLEHGDRLMAALFGAREQAT